MFFFSFFCFFFVLFFVSSAIVRFPPIQKQIEDLSEFFKVYEKEMKHFGMLQKVEDSHNVSFFFLIKKIKKQFIISFAFFFYLFFLPFQYLREHPHLMCDHLASFLVVWCVDLQVDEASSCSIVEF